MRYILFALVAALCVWYGSAAECPPEEQIKPCTCEDFLGLIQCGDITDMQVLVDVFNRTGDRKFQFFALYNSSVMYLPATAISSKGFDNLLISNVSMSALFDALPYDANEITMIIIQDTSFQRGIGWELFKPMSKLLLFNAEHSEIKSLDNNFANNMNRGLTNLILKHTKTKKIQENAFADLTKLFTLEISDNDITELQRSQFASPSALKEMKFSRNQLTTLPEDLFTNMPVLEVVYFDGNKLTTVPDKLYRSVYSRSGVVNLLENPLVCDCSILWFVSEEKRLILGTCDSPSDKKGKYIPDLKKSDFNYC